MALLVKSCAAALAVSIGFTAPTLLEPQPAVSGSHIVFGVLILALLLAVVGGRAAALHSAAGTAEPDAGQSARATTRKRAVVLGSGPLGIELAENLERGGNFEVLGFVDDVPASDTHGRWPVLGGRSAAREILTTWAIDEVFLAYTPPWQQSVAQELTVVRPDVAVSVVPSPFEALMRFDHVDSQGDIALVQLTGYSRRLWDRLKRGFDVVAAAAGLLLISPALAVLVFMIRRASPGPAIFSQERVGWNGQVFTAYKFRTMVNDAEADTGPVLSTGDDDDRLFPFGRWMRAHRVDEIPQLWNVLKGDMSIIGPRPERPVFVDDYNVTIPGYARRHQVRPGITGLAQVCAGYHTNPTDKLRFDLIYVAHQSLWMDLSILLRTIVVVLKP